MVEKIQHKHTREAAKKAHKALACSVPNCKLEYRAKGYCSTHYKVWRKGVFGKNRFIQCSKVDCKKHMEYAKRGFCETHYKEWWVARHPEAAAPAAA